MLDKFKKVIALVAIDEPTVLGYANLFEPGDIWIKTVGCQGCKLESRKKCCANCMAFYSKGCGFQIRGGASHKPFECVVKPVPNQGLSYCQMEFQCVAGKNKGKVRKMSDSLDVLKK